MKQKSRRWLVASVATAIVVTLIVVQLDNQKIYQALQNRLAQTGIQLIADHVSLSPMHMGSIRLDGAHIQTNAFSIDAERLFIDLDLAALLTGKALPQALYIQIADVNIKHSQHTKWLKLIANEGLKLKRIDISQSEIHFEKQHLTLEQVNLDIRDIGKNKNPRMELRAHIGAGRLDAHGYLHLKRGKITRGFSRLKLQDVPLEFLAHGTTLETLNGSITTHLNQDKTWQSFGHIALQAEHKNKVELRGKIIGSEQQLFEVSDMILSIKKAGSLQLSGACETIDSCHIDLNSQKLKSHPILSLWGNEVAAYEQKNNNTFQSINIENSWQNGELSSQGQVTWKSLEYVLPAAADGDNNSIKLDAGNFIYSGLTRDIYGHWALNQAEIQTANEEPSLSLEQATLSVGKLQLPLQLHQSKLWLPLLKLGGYSQKKAVAIQGHGLVTGNFEITLLQEKIQHISFDIDATNAEIQWHQALKPADVKLWCSGSVLWEKSSQKVEQALLSLHLGDAYAAIHRQGSIWQAQDLDVNFDQINEAGVLFPEAIRGWHGAIQGSFNFDKNEKNLQQSDVTLSNFGFKNHNISGTIKRVGRSWQNSQLDWVFGKNNASISTDKAGAISITASTMDTNGLALLQYLPLGSKGRFRAQSLALPFGTLKDTTATFTTLKQGVDLKHFKSTFYEGALRAKEVNISMHDHAFNITANMQVGGIHLNKWNWLHKQFQTHLEGTVYATLNLNTFFGSNNTSQLLNWSGDGDVVIYNGRWLLKNKNIEADQFNLSLRKRQKFTGKFKIKSGEKSGRGHILIDENQQVSGQLSWKKEIWKLEKTWPNIEYNSN